jgi:hypothetical protein
MKNLRGRMTYANVMATIAVFIALGGASYAAIKLPKNSVGTKQIKNGAVTGKKVAAHTLTGANINLSTLGIIPDAGHAANADNASHAANADNASHAANADNASHAANADNANTLGGLDSSHYTQQVASGSFNWDPASLAVGECAVESVSLQALSKGDIVVAEPEIIGSWYNAFRVSSLISPTSHQILFYLCNNSPATADQGAFELAWRVLR